LRREASFGQRLRRSVTSAARHSSFSQAATENALSRILIGFHFRKSTDEGTAYGRKIGERAATNYLRPVL